MLRLVLACAVLAMAAGVRADPPAPVRTDAGSLQGAPDGDSIAYKGIPYAAPPVGPLRWKPPQPVAAWTGVRPATAFGAICPQNAGMGTPAGAVQSEDCLTLNV